MAEERLEVPSNVRMKGFSYFKRLKKARKQAPFGREFSRSMHHRKMKPRRFVAIIILLPKQAQKRVKA